MSCDLCRLHKRSRNPCIGGDGATDLSRDGILLVGESPSETEDVRKRPFVGPTGQVLRSFVMKVLDDRVPIRYTNAVRCMFDPSSKKDLSIYINKCRHHLLEEIKVTRPSRIVAFGATAVRSLMGESLPIRQIVGGWGYSPFCSDIPVQFAIHPSAQLYNDAIAPYWRRTTGRILEEPPPNDWDGVDGVSSIIVDSVDGAVNVLVVASASKLVAYDIEYNPETNRILCVSIASSPNVSYSIPDYVLKDFRVLEALEGLFETTQMVAHNWKFDAWGSVKGLGFNPDVIIDRNNYWLDTSTMRKLHDPEQESKLALAEWMVGMGGHKDELFEILGHSHNGNSYEKAYNTHPDIVMRYCGGDSIACYRLAILYKDLLKEDGLWPLWSEIFGPLGKALFNMEKTGIRIDRNALDTVDKRLVKAMDIELSAIRSDPCVKRLCKNWILNYKKGNKEQKRLVVKSDDFNPKSVEQVRELLFSRHGLGLEAGARDKTAKGSNSVGKNIVKKHSEKNEVPVLKHLAEFNRLKHKHSTYVKGYEKRIEADGRIHTSYRQDTARTQRLSSQRPNLQNIPNRGFEEDKAIRRMFLPNAVDEYLMELDFGQMELRMAADLSNDSVMMDCFVNGIDIHKKTASEILGCNVEEVSKDDRSKAKPINFGVTFGMQPKKLKEYAKQDYGVELSDMEAAQWHRGFFKLYAGYKRWMLKESIRARNQGCAYIYWCGEIYARRWLSDLGSRNLSKQMHAERVAINTPIQGNASLYTLKSIIIIENMIYNGEVPGVSAILHTVHDSIIVSVKKAYVESAFKILGGVMVGWPTIRVPLEVEGKAGPNLADMAEIGKLDSRDL